MPVSVSVLSEVSKLLQNSRGNTSYIYGFISEVATRTGHIILVTVGCFQHLIRIALSVVYGMFPSNRFMIPCAIFLLLVLLFLLAVLHPYKFPAHNIIIICLLFIVCLFGVSSTADVTAYSTDSFFVQHNIRKLTDYITAIFSVIPLVFYYPNVV